MSDESVRDSRFTRNQNLEELLDEVNSLLLPISRTLADDCHEKYPKIFVMGPLRSGTTLFTQWLASSGLVAYPTNLLSRFYASPVVGAKIQLLLTDSRYNYRNEILDFNSKVGYLSENGKTIGALSPNEFWYFWRRFLPFDDLDYLGDEALKDQADLKGLRDELNALTNIFDKPFCLKGMILNQNISVLDSIFDKAIFVWMKRDLVFNVQSALEARKRQYGDIERWYSFKIKEYPELSKLPPLESVAGQIHSINTSIEKAFDGLPENKKLVVEYEDFCRNPMSYYSSIVKKLSQHEGFFISDREYTGPDSFVVNNTWRLSEYSQSFVRDKCKKIKWQND